MKKERKKTDRERDRRARKTAMLGVLAAIAILCGYIEYLIPIPIGIPGIKLGLCNVVIVLVLYTCTWREALIISVIRVLVIGFLFGNMFSIAFGMAGALLSLLVMALLRRTDAFSVVGVSAAGGTAHNVGQMAVAYVVTPTIPLLWYLPVLMIAGLVTGIAIGALSLAVMKRIRGVSFLT